MKKRIDEYYEENRERLEESKRATEAINREIALKIPFYIKTEMTEEEFKNVLMAKTIFQVSLTNSLKNLLHKGLIDATFSRFWKQIKGIELTKKGVELIERFI